MARRKQRSDDVNDRFRSLLGSILADALKEFADDETMTLADCVNAAQIDWEITAANAQLKAKLDWERIYNHLNDMFNQQDTLLLDILCDRLCNPDRYPSSGENDTDDDEDE